MTLTVERKLLRVMRLTSIILLTTCLHVAARTVSQTVTFHGTNVPLEKIFNAVEQQTGYLFIYNPALLDQSKPVTVAAEEMPLEKFLHNILRRQQLEFVFKDKTIVIQQKKITPPPALLPAPPVTGIVRGPDGQPLAGVNVVVKGTTRGVATGADGGFSIDAESGDILIISAVGHGAKEIRVNGEDNYSITLELRTSPLDEVQIIAYGTTSKRLSTGNVSSVKAKDIQQQPVNNPLLALQGRVPGLFITQNTGISGGGITVRIQGQNSLNRGNDPLYVIDGVPYNSQLLPNISGNFGILGDNGNTSPSPGGGGNPLAFLSPGDIESIEVLKDADATSIYGSRAAAGAILITTRKGTPGKTTVDVNLRSGWGKVSKHLSLLNTQQYLEMRHEALANDGLSPGPADVDVNGTWDTTRETDWQKKLIGGTAQYLDANASVSGGNNYTQFLVSTGYHRESTVFPGDFDDKKLAVHFNVNHATANNKFRMQLSGNYVADNNTLPNVDLTTSAIRLAPNAPALYDGDGSLNWAANGGASTWYNPLAFLTREYNIKTNNLVSNAHVSYELLKGLELKSSFGYNRMWRDEYALNPSVSNAPELRAFTPRSSNFSYANNSSWILEPQITYQQNLRDGVLDVLLGTTFLSNSADMQLFNARGFSSDQALRDIKSAPLITGMQNIGSVYNYNAIFTRINYNWSDKYILNVNMRRDGSSRFGAENLFNNFASVAGAWLFATETFIKDNLKFLSFGKLRVSYGSTGNDQIGDYQFMSLFNPVYAPVAYQGAVGLTASGLPNPLLQWEKTVKLQSGLELGFIHDRILLNLNYYRNRSSNQLLFYTLPATSGFSGIQENLPATIQNTGWEISLSTTNVKTKNFSWSSSANITIPKTKLLSYPDLEKSTYASVYIIGKPLGSRRFKSAGVDPATGLFWFYDEKGNMTSSPLDPVDRTLFTTNDPVYYGGVQNSVTYKSFQLDFLFQFVKQKADNYSLGQYPGMFISSNMPDGNIANQPATVLDRWQKPGDDKRLQKFSAVYPFDLLFPYINTGSSDWAFSDASYIRLKNVSVSWHTPANWNKKLRIERIRLFIQGQNLLTITNYTGLDPESKSLTNLPPLKVWTFGIQLTL